jgi:hypothetical protein
MQTEAFLALVQQRQAVKVIAGIDNTHIENVLAVVHAAEAGGAAAVDVAAEAAVLEAVLKARTSVAIFASGVEPAKLAMAIEMGADIAELGNFDALYQQGQFFSAQQVLALAQETRALLPQSALLSVTIPGHLAQDAQANLALSLEALKVNFIQTEGATRLLAKTQTVQSLEASEKEQLTLGNTKNLANVTTLPLMTASGLTPQGIQKAFACGASVVGVGTYIRSAKTTEEMITRVARIVEEASSAMPVQTAIAV